MELCTYNLKIDISEESFEVFRLCIQTQSLIQIYK